MESINFILHDINNFNIVANTLMHLTPEFNMSFVKNDCIENITQNNQMNIPTDITLDAATQSEKITEIIDGNNSDSDNSYTSNDVVDEKDKNDGYIRIFTYNDWRSMAVLIKLSGTYEKFDAEKQNHKFGIDTGTLRKYVNIVKKYERLRIVMDSDPHKIKFSAINSYSTLSNFDLRLVSLETKDIKIDMPEVIMYVHMPSLEFHETCSQLYKISENLEISCNTTKFIISCKGDKADCNVIFTADDNHIIRQLDKNNIHDINQKYKLRDINSLYGFHHFSKGVDIFFTVTGMMILKYVKENDQIIVYFSSIASTNKKIY